MRSRCTYELVEGKTCHFDAAFSGTATCDWKLDTFVGIEDQLEEMGGLFSQSNDEPVREPVQTGVREGKVVVVTRTQTDFPRNSRGGWSGNVYCITASNKVMYESPRVPDDLRGKLGNGKLTIDGKVARIQFLETNGKIHEHF